MRNSKTLELFESIRNNYENAKILNECELPSTKDGTAKKEIEDQLERTRKRKDEVGIEESENYACYEAPFNGETKTKEQWKEYYNSNIDKNEWATFEDWWQDMTGKDKLISESEVLEEKINKDNAEINEKILKALNGKRDAREIEPELNKHGIKVDYGPSQGTILRGNNGRVLSSDRKGVYGPSNPGFNNTHAKFDNSYNNWSKDYKNRAEEYELKLKQLKDMDRDDIIRKYNDKSTEEAMKAHQADIEKYEKWAQEYRDDEEKYAKRAVSDRRGTRMSRRMGHERDPRSNYSEPIRKDNAPERFNSETRKYEKSGMSSADKVDYLNYLTKKPTGFRTEDIYGRGSKYNPSEDMNKRVKDYRGLKSNVDRAKDHLDFENKYYRVKSDEELEKAAAETRARAEEQINKDREINERNRANTKSAQDAVTAAEKAKEDYMKKVRADRANRKN